MAKLSLVAVMSLFALSATAQRAWEASEVKGRTSVFICETRGNYLLITNSNYIDPRKTRIEYNFDVLGYSYVRIISHDPFLEAFKESFRADRITQLATVNDFVSLIFEVDEKGQVLGISFSLDKGSAILPEELEMLEQELLSRVKFGVIGKKVEGMFFHSLHLRVYFTEVQDGELRMVRTSVNLKNSTQD